MMLVKKNHLHPKILVINADDLGNPDLGFFSRNVELSTDKGDSGNVIYYGAIQGMINVFITNVHWRIEKNIQQYLSEDSITNLAEYLPQGLDKFVFPGEKRVNYRSSVNGGWFNDVWPDYNNKNNGDLLGVEKVIAYLSSQSEPYVRLLPHTALGN